MSVEAGGQLDMETAEALGRTFEPAESWIERVGRPATLPAPGSELAVDDQATDPRRLSHLALTAVGAAVDHFHASSLLISTGRVVHMNAQFTLLRAALENAATAVFMLGPDDSQERIFRALRIAWSDVVDQHNLLDNVNQPPRKSLAAHKTELQNLAKAQGMTKADVAKIAARALSYSMIVKTAGAEAFGDKVGPLALTIWMVNSGSAHGKQWEAITKIDRANLVATDDVTVSQGQVTAGSTQLRLSAVMARRMIERAWALYDQRRAA
ncbi:hypothetical protein [Amycolatopsis sp. MtRt-6]|uniref:hypothetical protein n=1 Tax=Amycolatopsis sp. MtRt-6 TaxID=2792782 RepID=UPI001A903449|nr:hypothetical protein [Amycolatopsis sp. MtRt-6]